MIRSPYGPTVCGCGDPQCRRGCFGAAPDGGADPFETVFSNFWAQALVARERVLSRRAAYDADLTELNSLAAQHRAGGGKLREISRVAGDITEAARRTDATNVAAMADLAKGFVATVPVAGYAAFGGLGNACWVDAAGKTVCSTTEVRPAPVAQKVVLTEADFDPLVVEGARPAGGSGFKVLLGLAAMYGAWRWFK